LIKILLVSIKRYFLHMGRQYFVKKLTINYWTFRFQGVNYHYITSLSGQGSPIYPYPLSSNMHLSSGWKEDNRNIFKTNAFSTFQFTKYYQRTMHLSTHSNSNKGCFKWNTVAYFTGPAFWSPREFYEIFHGI